MARRRRSTPATVQARDIATTIRQGERRGLTQREIAATLGINERTVRKIKAGETSGTRTHERLTHRPRRPGATPNAFNAEFIVGYDANNEPVYASANIIIADVRTRTGERRAPTGLDVFRVNIDAVVQRERAAMARRYDTQRLATGGTATRIRSINTMRKPAAAILRTNA